jgi:hypothetical protein
MSIERTTGTCIVVHLADSEAHFPDTQQAEEWIGKLDVGLHVHAIEETQVPCWTAECDSPDCVGTEDDEHGNATHFLAGSEFDVEFELSDLQRQPDGVLLCTLCRER